MIFASGAGANSRISVGSTVFGGMVAACTLGAVLTPAFYVLVQEFVDRFPKKEISEKSSSKKLKSNILLCFKHISS